MFSRSRATYLNEEAQGGQTYRAFPFSKSSLLWMIDAIYIQMLELECACLTRLGNIFLRPWLGDSLLGYCITFIITFIDACGSSLSIWHEFSC
jgi:hypothetical protein